MKELFDSVRQFHELSGQPILNYPEIPFNDRVKLREKLMQEELEEIFDGADREDLVEVLDGLGDLIFVTIGTAIEFGISEDCLLEAFREITRSNLTKSVSKSTPAELLEKEVQIFNDKGKVVSLVERGERFIFVNIKTGKIEKPSTYSPSDLAPILQKYETR